MSPHEGRRKWKAEKSYIRRTIGLVASSSYSRYRRIDRRPISSRLAPLQPANVIDCRWKCQRFVFSPYRLIPSFALSGNSFPRNAPFCSAKSNPCDGSYIYIGKLSKQRERVLYTENAILPSIISIIGGIYTRAREEINREYTSRPHWGLRSSLYIYIYSVIRTVNFRIVISISYT